MAITKKALIEHLEARKVELEGYLQSLPRDLPNLDQPRYGAAACICEINHIIEEIIPKVPDALPGAEDAERGLEMLRGSSPAFRRPWCGRKEGGS